MRELVRSRGPESWDVSFAQCNGMLMDKDALTSCPNRFSADSFRTFFARTPATAAAIAVVLQVDEVGDIQTADVNIGSSGVESRGRREIKANGSRKRERGTRLK